MGDNSNRIFHIYGDTRSDLGVSRFNLATEFFILLGSQLIMLAPIHYNASAPSPYLAIDTLGFILFPVLCDFVDTTILSNFFLVKDVDVGIAMLESAEASWIVTGGAVSSCNVIVLAFSAVSSSQWTCV